MTDESEIQKDIKGKWNRWEHSTKPHAPQGVNKFLPNYVDIDKPDIEKPKEVKKNVKSNKR